MCSGFKGQARGGPPGGIGCWVGIQDNCTYLCLSLGPGCPLTLPFSFFPLLLKVPLYFHVVLGIESRVLFLSYVYALVKGL